MDVQEYAKRACRVPSLELYGELQYGLSVSHSLISAPKMDWLLYIKHYVNGTTLDTDSCCYFLNFCHQQHELSVNRNVEGTAIVSLKYVPENGYVASWSRVVLDNLMVTQLVTVLSALLLYRGHNPRAPALIYTCTRNFWKEKLVSASTKEQPPIAAFLFLWLPFYVNY
jgi:hypothetical protein